MPLRRQQIRFLLRFAALLILFYLIVTPEPVDRHFVTRFSAVIAAVSAGVLRLFGEHVSQIGTIVRGPRLAIDIKNGCNGLEATIFLVAAMIAFQASLRSRLIGIVAACVGIQVLNLVRIVTLYLLAAYRPALFETFHLAVWQSVIFGAAVLMFFVWTARVQRNNVAARS